MTVSPQIRGWCPGALRPMLSGDGWVVRIRPPMGRITAAQAEGLARLAASFGNGLIDISSRANIQLRGVRDETQASLLEGLEAWGLLDRSAEAESRRNVVVEPFWTEGDLTFRTAQALAIAVDRMPDLSGKFGYAIDAGPVPVLQETPADIRMERDADGHPLLVADGFRAAKPVAEEDAVEEMLALAHWFKDHRGTRRRMAALMREGAHLPSGFVIPRQAPAVRPVPGLTASGAVVALAFGQMTHGTLAALARLGPLRITPWRMVLIEDAVEMPAIEGTITGPDDPLLNVVACTGAPGCAQALGETRALARRLARHTTQTLHISGCTKGCAHPRAAPLTVVAGRDGYDLIRAGTAGDPPERRNLTPEQIEKAL